MKILQNDITEQRRINRQKVYKSLYFSNKPKTKKELSSELGLSFPTINQNVSELCDAKLIHEKKSTNFTGGRHANVLDVSANAYYSIGVSVTDINIRIVVTNLKFEQIAYKKIPYKTNSFKTEISQFISDEIDIISLEKSINQNKVLGVGIAIPALIDKENGLIISSPTLKLNNTPYDFLTKNIKFKTFIENDGTSGGFCEFYFSENKQNMAYLSLENGVGGAIIIGGSPYWGDNVKSAEFGHICVENNGILCNCGKKGCLESYCNALRFSENLGITLEQFTEELEKGNRKYRDLWDDMLKHLAIAINNIHVMLDCPVVLGGFLSSTVELYFDRLKEFIITNQNDNDVSYLSICKFKNKSVCNGMALHFVNEFIDNI